MNEKEKIENTLGLIYNNLKGLEEYNEDKILNKANCSEVLGFLDEEYVKLGKVLDLNRKRETLMLRDSNEKLRELEEKLKATDSRKFLSEGINGSYELVSKWWDDLGFNYIKDFKVEYSGRITCMFGFMLFKMNSTGENSVTIKKENEILLKELKSKYDISKVVTGEEILDTDKNKALIVAEIKKFSPNSSVVTWHINEFKGIRFIRNVEVTIDLKDLDCKSEQVEEVEDERKISFILTEDESAFIQKTLRNSYGALSMLNETLKNTDIDSFKEKSNSYFQVIFYYFSDICKTLGYDSKITKQVEDLHREERERNIKIREMENMIKKKIKLKEIPEYVKEVHSLIKNWWTGEGFIRVSNLEFTRHGALLVDLGINMGDLCILAMLEEEGLTPKSIVDIKREYEVSYINEDNCFLLENDSNRQRIIDLIVKKFPSAIIEDMLSTRIDSRRRAINKISIEILDIQDVFAD